MDTVHEVVEKCGGLLPIGLAENVRLVRGAKKGEAIAEDAVELNESSLLVKLWREQNRMSVGAPTLIIAHLHHDATD